MPRRRPRVIHANSMPGTHSVNKEKSYNTRVECHAILPAYEGRVAMYTYSMKKVVFSALVSMCFPFLAYAASAGFAPGALFLSQTNVKNGDSVRVFAVVYDGGTASLEGDVLFSVDGKQIDTAHFVLQGGETRVLSAQWKATPGSHSFSASLSGAGEVTGAKTNTETITVEAPPAPPSPEMQAAASAVSTVQNTIASTSPVVVEAVQQFFDTTEAARNNAVDALAQTLAIASSTPKGQVLGTSDYLAPATSSSTPASGKIGSIVGSLWHTILSILYTICRSQVLFYGLAVFVLFLLIQLIRTMLRERY